MIRSYPPTPELHRQLQDGSIEGRIVSVSCQQDNTPIMVVVPISVFPQSRPHSAYASTAHDPVCIWGWSSLHFIAQAKAGVYLFEGSGSVAQGALGILGWLGLGAEGRWGRVHRWDKWRRWLSSEEADVLMLWVSANNITKPTQASTGITPKAITLPSRRPIHTNIRRTCSYALVVLRQCM